MNPGLPPLRVLVVDDHDIVRLGVRHVLSAQRRECVVCDAVSTRDALGLLAVQSFDLMLLDLSLSDEFALTALPRMREACPAMKIVVLTSLPESLYAERCLRAGADGFVMKSAIGQTLLHAVQTVLAGQIYLSPGQNSSLLRRAAGRQTPDGKPELSPREIEVLHMVAAGRSTREIADSLNRSVKTIETHKQALRSKLDAQTPAMLMRKALDWFGDAR